MIKILTPQEEYSKIKSRDFISIECSQCKKEFRRKKNDVNTTLKRYNNIYCSKDCYNKSKKTVIIFSCLNCKKDVERTPSQIKKSGKIFCSYICAALYNGLSNSKKRERKLKQRTCKKCNKKIPRPHVLCETCMSKKFKRHNEYNLEEYKTAISKSKSIASSLEFLNLNQLYSSHRKYIKSLIQRHNISISHFSNAPWNKNKKNTSGPKLSTKEYFAENTARSSSGVRKRLIKEGIKKEVCERCGRKT